jgi:hypothetical protein
MVIVARLASRNTYRPSGPPFGPDLLLMVQVPRQQPFLRRVQNRIRREAKTAKRVRDPEVEPF